MQLRRIVHNMHKDDNKRLSVFYKIVEKLIIDFPKEAFFSDFIKLEYHIKDTLALFNITTKRGTKILNKLNVLISKRKQELLSLWGIDIIAGFEVLQHSITRNDIAAIAFKFATNHNQHALDVASQADAYPEVATMFLANIEAAISIKTAMPGMSEIKKKLQKLAASPVITPEIVEGIQQLFTQAVTLKQELLKQEKDVLHFFNTINTQPETQRTMLEKLRQDLIDYGLEETVQVVFDLDSNSGVLAKMFFDIVKQQAISSDGQNATFFTGCEENIQGVEQAMIKAIDARLAQLKQLKPPLSITRLPLLSEQPSLKGSSDDHGPMVITRTHNESDYYHRLRKVADKEESTIQNKLNKLHTITMYGDISKSEFDILRERINGRIASYGTPRESIEPSSSLVATRESPSELPVSELGPSFPQAKAPKEIEQEASARKVYQGTSVSEVSTANKFTMSASDGEMFNVTLQPAQSITLTFASQAPKPAAIVAAAEVMKDAESLLKQKGKKVKDLLIRDYEKKPIAGLAIYCSLASQEKPVVFAGDFFLQATAKNQGFYEVYLLLQRMMKTREGKDQLLHLVEDGNAKLEEMVKYVQTQYKEDQDHYGTIPTPRQVDEMISSLQHKYFSKLGDPPFIPPTGNSTHLGDDASIA